MEEKLDNIAEGAMSRTKLLKSFYDPFLKELEIANVKIYLDDPEYTGENCPECGAPLIYKDGKNGKFIGCSNFPKCKYIKKEEKGPVYTGENCPICGKPLVEREDKRGKKFVACSGYPECRYIKAEVKAEDGTNSKICPKCGGYLVKKKGKYGYFYGCSNYPNCDYMEKVRRKKGK